MDQSPKTTWTDTLDHSSNNCFDLLRLLFAAAVIVYHSFYLVPDVDRDGVAFRLLAGEYGAGVGRRLDLGAMAVLGFFVISGYLIALSASDSSLAAYVKKRVLRIGPGFFLVSIIGLLVIAPIAWNGSGNYYSQQRWFGLIAGIAVFKSVSPPHIFLNNPDGLLNGSLWSIRYEVDCYVMLGFLALLGQGASRIAIALLLGFIGIEAAADHQILHLPVIDHGLLALAISSPDYWPGLFPFFLAGSLFFMFRERIPRSLALLALAGALVVLSVCLSLFRPVLPIAFAYVVLFCASALNWHLMVKGQRADLSYGMYIYAWPIQQGLAAWAFVSSPWLLMALTLGLLVPISYASWRFIEQPCLSFARAELRVASRSRESQLPRP